MMKIETPLPIPTMTTFGALSPTPAERRAGRFMRAPDHDAGTGGDGGEGEGADKDAGGGGQEGGDAGAGGEGGDAGTGADQVTTPADGEADAGKAGDDDTSIAGGAGAGKEGEGAETDKGGEGEGGDEPPILGAPETYEVKVPEALAEKGMEFDKEVFGLVEPELRAMNLSNDAAQRLTNVYAEKVVPALVARGEKQAESAQLERAATIRKEWEDAAKADPEIGGQNYDKTVDACAQVWDRYGIKRGTGFRQLLDESGLGNHPEMLRFLSRVASTTGEGRFVPSDGSGGGGRKSDAEVFYPDMATKA